MHTLVHTCIYAYVYLHIYIYMYVYIYIYTYIHIWNCFTSYTQVHSNICVYTHIHNENIRMYICSANVGQFSQYIYTTVFTHTHRCIHMFVCTHTAIMKIFTCTYAVQKWVRFPDTMVDMTLHTYMHTYIHTYMSYACMQCKSASGSPTRWWM